MPVSQTFRQWVHDQLRPSVRGLRDLRMFGGVGIYSGDLFFALLAEDRLYLKVDDSNRADFVAAGTGPFQPFGHEGITMQYYEVPLEVIESPQQLASWAAKAIAVAQAAKESKSAKSRKPRTTKKSSATSKSRKVTKRSTTP
ncbi:TfoX/Sxy family protein [Anatilimnocola sp. NA78]|uniref:TfoX/Sxy family protein n=1 Tax=Anatilimnocola sp. NA78 TaxID=3415683 RepID=UPI003CE5BD26